MDDYLIKLIVTEYQRELGELKDFINEMTKSIKCMESKMILQDIIMVYYGCYGETYDDYKEYILRANEKARDFRNLNYHDFNTILDYMPDHIILEEFQFNFIKSLRGIYDSNR